MPFPYQDVFSLRELVHVALNASCNPPLATACTLTPAWVWAPPRSLAATWGISVDFFSSRYLDGSVPWVSLRAPIRFSARSLILIRWVTPFGYPRITGYVLLPAAFRSLSRPSSPCGSIGIHQYARIRLTILCFTLLPAAFRSASKERHSFFDLIAYLRLSQVRLLPFPRVSMNHFHQHPIKSVAVKSVGQNRVELLTPSLSEKCSNRLSYWPKKIRKGQSKIVMGIAAFDQGPYGVLPIARAPRPFSQKGGDPAAPSGTTTLLRLHPPHETYLRRRPPCG